jgi:GT2 family glycosyltransferase
MTVAAVRRALAQVSQNRVVRAFLTDDGSTDGTARAVVALNGPVTVIPGDGSLYWAAGMELAERAAMASDPDYLLWLNDDTLLDADALERLLAVHEQHPDAIVVGATRDPDTGEVSYGGRRHVSRWHPQRFVKLESSDEVQRADTFNGNVVLVPRSVRDAVGPIDGRFPHSYADDDYGLRARSKGVPLLQAPGTIGECKGNEEGAVELRGPRAWRALQQPKGLPWRAQVRFLRRHGGRVWPLVFVGQQSKVLLGLRPVRVSRTSAHRVRFRPLTEAGSFDQDAATWHQSPNSCGSGSAHPSRTGRRRE